MNTPKKTDPTQAQRTSRYRAKGRFVGVLVRDGEAVETLEAMELEHGSLAGAINAALLHYGATRLEPTYREAAAVLRQNKKEANDEQPQKQRRSPRRV